MAAIPVRPDDSIPIAEGGRYAIKPGALAGCWLEIVSIHNGYVHTRGIEGCIADWIVPVWKFDDLVQEYILRVFYLLLESDGTEIVLATEDNEALLAG